jgi:hypothetical protein
MLLVPPTSFAASTIQSAICGQFVAPVITLPPPDSQTNDTSVVVQGSGEPLMTVSILRNGQSVGVTLAASDGSYALEVPLVVGANSLVAREVDPCGTVKESVPVGIERLSTEVPQEEAPDTASAPIATPTFPGLDQTDRPLERPIVVTPPTPGYQRPTIVYPLARTTTHSNRIWIKGDAQAGSVVIVYVNGISVARTIASDDGSYGVLVTLIEGENSLQVKSRLGSASAASDPVFVTYEKQLLAPVTPVEVAIAPTVFLLGISFLVVLGVGWIYEFRVRTPKS